MLSTIIVSVTHFNAGSDIVPQYINTTFLICLSV